jgi:flagellar motility protein MotE (MotC chaperone)
MKEQPKTKLICCLLLAGSMGHAAVLAGWPSAAGAQGWTTEFAETKKAPPRPAPKRSAAPAKSAPVAKAKARPETPKTTIIETAKTEPARMEQALPGDLPKPQQTEVPAVAMEPAAAAATAKPAEAPPVIAENMLGGEDAEPDDPFMDLKVLSRQGAGDVLTTQVAPETPAIHSPAETAQADRSAASQYCSNIADAAIDARIAWQRQNLAEAEKEVQKRTAELEVKTAEYQRWLARRDEFAQKAQKAVTDIYSKMKPDSAAAQLQALDDETAAAVISKLDARVASSVMNEMEPVQAARLTAILSGAGKVPQPKLRQPPPAPAGNRS